MVTVNEAVMEILGQIKALLTDSSYITMYRVYMQLLKMAKEQNIIYPCQELFDSFARDDRGKTSRRKKHMMVLKRLDAATTFHAMRPDYRPFNPIPLPSFEKADTVLSAVSFPVKDDVDLGFLIARAQNELALQGHKPNSSDDDYLDAMQTMYCFFLRNGKNGYTAKCLDDFLVWIDQLLKDSCIQKKRWYILRKAAHIIREVSETGHYSWYMISGSSKLSGSGLEDLRCRYVRHLEAENLRKSTIRNLIGTFNDFIRFKEAGSSDDLKGVTATDVQKAASYLYGKHDISAFRTLHSRLRRVLHFFYEEGITSSDLSNCIMKPSVVCDNVAGYFSQEDEAHMYRYLDNVSLRNKAICLIALELGLRDYDISHLRFDQIDWNADQIHIVQHKTDEALTLPLTVNVGNALMAYIMNERPKTKEPIPYIFLTEVAPFRRLKNVYYPCRKLIDASGATPKQGKHKGTHIFRDNLVHRMLTKEVPYQVITDTLGHVSRDSDKSYISLEPEMLRRCAIGLDLIGHPRWEGGASNV